jgi:hypothetical protein
MYSVKILKFPFYIPFSSFFVFLTMYNTFLLAEIMGHAILFDPWLMYCVLSQLPKIICNSMADTRPGRKHVCTDAPVNAEIQLDYCRNKVC